jgi:hypothetical protein
MAYNRTSIKSVRQFKRLLNAASNCLAFQEYDGGTLLCSFDSGSQGLTRSKNGVADHAHCSSNALTKISFPLLNKLVQPSWICRRPDQVAKLSE